ncbi:MAG: hypothetical protein ACRD5L_01130, partial [Bryobacteraceae bacterium]
MKVLLAVVVLGWSARAQSSSDPPEAPKLSETLGAGELLLLKEPGVVTDPLDFGQMAREKLAVFSSQGWSWTASRFRVEGMDATDPYQPGRPLVSADAGGVAQFRVERDTLEPILSYSFRTAASAWHFSAAGFFTGSALSSGNLPPPSQRGALQRSEEFQMFGQPRFELGGPINRWLDAFFSGSGRSSVQTAPLETTNRGIKTYDLDATFRANIRPNARNRFDVLILGAREDDYAWSLPFGLEALSARRMAPPIGFEPNLSEQDHLDYVQTGWHRTWLGGELEARYSYSATHISTLARTGTLPSTFLGVVAAGLETAYVELTSGATHGGPLLQTAPVRPRHGGLATWRKDNIRHNGVSHSLNLIVYVDRALIRNRFENPPLSYAITSAGVPSSAVILNTAVEPSATVRHFDFGFDDRIRLGSRVTISEQVILSAWNGGTPAQGEPPGGGPLMFAAKPDLIVWKNAGSRFGVALRVPGVNALVLRAGLGRSYEPLAGRYLDFGNPNAISGLEYKWVDANHDGVFDSSEEAGLLSRFGGAYSAIDPNLRQPHTDEFYAAAELSLPHGAFARIRVFERTDKDRIAAVNTGVPFGSYTPRQIVDPGPDGVAGTADDRTITVYEQNPATFGQDFFTLTNPAGLKMQQRGMLAEGGFQTSKLTVQGSLYVGQSRGMTNPGNNSWENDS